jgi:DNA-binding transcriptional MocR family regulator
MLRIIIWLKPNPGSCFFAPERTIYVTGFSKNVATGLRIGVIICPEVYRPALERAVRATTWNTPSLIVSLVCNWIQDGTVSRFETLKGVMHVSDRGYLRKRLDTRPVYHILIRILHGSLFRKI